MHVRDDFYYYEEREERRSTIILTMKEKQKQHFKSLLLEITVKTIEKKLLVRERQVLD